MGKSTMIELVQELDKIEKHPLIDVIIEDAKAGELHDFKNEKYVCGKQAAVGMLRVAMLAHPNPEAVAQLKKIRDDIIDGEYDETMDDDDKERMRKDIMGNSSTPQEADALMKITGL